MTQSTQPLTDRHVSVRLSRQLLLERGFYQNPGFPNEYHYDIQSLQHKVTTLVLTATTVNTKGFRLAAYKAKRVVEYTDHRMYVLEVPEIVETTGQLAVLLHYFKSLTEN